MQNTYLYYGERRRRATFVEKFRRRCRRSSRLSKIIVANLELNFCVGEQSIRLLVGVQDLPREEIVARRRQLPTEKNTGTTRL